MTTDDFNLGNTLFRLAFLIAGQSTFLLQSFVIKTHQDCNRRAAFTIIVETSRTRRVDPFAGWYDQFARAVTILKLFFSDSLVELRLSQSILAERSCIFFDYTVRLG